MKPKHSLALPPQTVLKAKRAAWPWYWRYALAVGLFAATIALSILLNSFSTKINLTIPIVLALVATAWYGGRGPGVLISILFQATTIIYIPIPPDSNLVKAWFGYFSVFSLYVFLVLVISGLRTVQHRLSQQRDLLAVTLSSIGDAVIATDNNGLITFMNPVAATLTGWEESRALGTPLEDVFQVINEESGDPAGSPVERVLGAGGMIGPENHSLLKAGDGRTIPIDSSAAPIRDAGQIKGVVLVFSDVTERRLAERSRRETEIMYRIVEAQEAERHRIARDLHDHLGQKMTALRLGIGTLTEKCAGDPALSRATRELQESASNIDRDIGFLSWELRPTELEDLGLVDALRSFVREWSTQYGIPAEFQVREVPTDVEQRRLTENVETNLYRIVQEALNNILKHAEAKSVSVLLHQRKNEIALIIEDNGLGFEREPDSTPSAKPGGLGLVGMQERAASMNGVLEIETRLGIGTTIMAQIPLV
jgi:PAS domain S-box-containing protein